MNTIHKDPKFEEKKKWLLETYGSYEKAVESIASTILLEVKLGIDVYDILESQFNDAPWEMTMEVARDHGDKIMEKLDKILSELKNDVISHIKSKYKSIDELAKIVFWDYYANKYMIDFTEFDDYKRFLTGKVIAKLELVLPDFKSAYMERFNLKQKLAQGG